MPSDLRDLPTEDDDNWVRGLVLASELDQLPWLATHYSVHLLRKRPGAEFVEVAVHEPHCGRLCNYVTLHADATGQCLYEPSEREKWVYGIHAARSRSRRFFIQRVVDGILTRGPGLGRFYQQGIDDAGLQAVIEWAILRRDFQASLFCIIVCYSANFA